MAVRPAQPHHLQMPIRKVIPKTDRESFANVKVETPSNLFVELIIVRELLGKFRNLLHSFQQHLPLALSLPVEKVIRLDFEEQSPLHSAEDSGGLSRPLLPCDSRCGFGPAMTAERCASNCFRSPGESAITCSLNSSSVIAGPVQGWPATTPRAWSSASASSARFRFTRSIPPHDVASFSSIAASNSRRSSDRRSALMLRYKVNLKRRARSSGVSDSDSAFKYSTFIRGSSHNARTFATADFDL